jgi:hypothetical protein
MAELSTKVKLYLEANGKTYDGERDNFSLLDDGVGSYIGKWEVSGLDKPTDSQLDSYELSATTEDNNFQVIRTRKGLYGSTAEQLEYIVENGVDAFVAKQNQIKSDNPKE